MNRRSGNRLYVENTKGAMPLSESASLLPVVQPRIAVLGAPGVGKSSLIFQFLYHQYQFDDEEKDSKDGLSLIDCDLQQEAGLTMKFRDMSCSDEHEPLRRLVISSSDAFVLVYSRDDPASFDTVTKLREKILQSRENGSCPIVVVANKLDIDDGSHHLQNVVHELVASVDWEHSHVTTSVWEDGTSSLRVFREVLQQMADFGDHVLAAVAHIQRQITGDCDPRKRQNRLSKRVRNLIACQ